MITNISGIMCSSPYTSTFQTHRVRVLATWQIIWILLWVVIKILYLSVKIPISECPHYTAGIGVLVPVENSPVLIASFQFS